MSKYLIGSVVTIVVAAALAGAFYLGKGQMPLGRADTEPKPTTVTQFIEPTNVPAPSASPQVEDKASGAGGVAENIEAGVVSKDYAAIASYMNNKVNVVLYATECCGLVSAIDAAKQLDYLSSATPPWNFKENNPIALKLRDNSDFFKEATLIGTASNGYAVGFTLDDQAKIKFIVLVADYKLITQ